MPTPATTRRSRQRPSTASTCPASSRPASSRLDRVVPRLLVRDLTQLVSPAGGGAPLRGAALGELDVIDGGYVLCDGERIAEVGRMRELEPLDADVAELDGRGLCAVPGLVDCHTHAAFAGDRVDEFSLRAAGASYEELHAAGGGILSTVVATRAAGEAELLRAVERHRRWMLRAGTTTFEAKSGYGLDRGTELASLRAIRAAGSRCACTATSSRKQERFRSRSSSARVRSTTSRRRGRKAFARSRAAIWSACCSRRAR